MVQIQNKKKSVPLGWQIFSFQWYKSKIEKKTNHCGGEIIRFQWYKRKGDSISPAGSVGA